MLTFYIHAQSATRRTVVYAAAAMACLDAAAAFAPLSLALPAVASVRASAPPLALRAHAEAEAMPRRAALRLAVNA